MILLIDNYDSFSYNLYQATATFRPDIEVIRNDALTVPQIAELNPEAIIISPGPGRPSDAGVCIEAIKHFADRLPVLGVCLGHQAICEAFGATVSHAKRLMHGKSSLVDVDTKSPLFKNMTSPISAGRYHSLAALKNTMPACLKITATTKDGEIMAVQHTDYKIYGVQFHPESILTENGNLIIKNFLEVI
jgi:anthranilate synthase component 2